MIFHFILFQFLTSSILITGSCLGNSSLLETNPAEQEILCFTPPENWHLADTSSISPCVKSWVVGKGNGEFPPSINLSTEAYSGTLKDYLKCIKEINRSRGNQWKDLGKIQTFAGTGNLSQVDTKNQWGNVRMMHVILLKDGIMYILTAASLREEFPRFYKEFFESLSSLRCQRSNKAASS